MPQSISLNFSLMQNLERAGTYNLHKTWFFLVWAFKWGTEENDENFKFIEHLQKDSFPVGMSSIDWVWGSLKSEFCIDVEAFIVLFGVVIADAAEILGYVKTFIARSNSISLHFSPHSVDIEAFNFFLCDVNDSVCHSSKAVSLELFIFELEYVPVWLGSSCRNFFGDWIFMR
jgi:hypothetical protein